MYNWSPENLQINVSKILEFLGYKPGKMKVNPKINNCVDEELKYSMSLIEPEGIFKLLNENQLKNIDICKDADKVAFAIVTIGDKLENKVKELFQKGEATRAAILDAIGSLAVETTANLLSYEINEIAENQGYNTTKRFGPGYGNWAVEGQDIIFNNLDGAEKKLGVTLTSSKIMVPLKSVSFVVKLGKSAMEEINKGCDYCNLKEKCPFKYVNK